MTKRLNIQKTRWLNNHLPNILFIIKVNVIELLTNWFLQNNRDETKICGPMGIFSCFGPIVLIYWRNWWHKYPHLQSFSASKIESLTQKMHPRYEKFYIEGWVYPIFISGTISEDQIINLLTQEEVMKTLPQLPVLPRQVFFKVFWFLIRVTLINA